MLFVCLSHFGYAYFAKHGDLSLMSMTERVGMVASPTFVLISGLVLGFLYSSRKADFAQTQAKLADRGLFLLTAGHVLIVMAHVAYAGGVGAALSWGFMTDTIGFCIIVGPLVVSRVRTSHRALLALAMYLLSWVVILSWHVNSWGLHLIKEALFGQVGVPFHVYADVFPLLPWLSLYLFGTCIGERVGRYQTQRQRSRILSYISTLALICEAGAILIKGCSWLLRRWNSVLADNLVLNSLTYQYHKLPPSPVYFLFFGGIGLGIMYLYFLLEQRHLANGVIVQMTAVGQTSLFVFILQYYVYFTFLWMVDLPSGIPWTVYFLVSVAFIILTAQVWHDKGYNRLITLNPVTHALMRWQTRTH